LLLRGERGRDAHATKPPFTAIDTLAAALPAGAPVVRGFAAGVADQLAAGPLSYDRRQRLFARAALLGLGRFEANLLIAIAERQAGRAGIAPAVEPIVPTPMVLTNRMALCTIGVVQTLIVGAAWWALV
jgi:hypothetical protein